MLRNAQKNTFQEKNEKMCKKLHHARHHAMSKEK